MGFQNYPCTTGQATLNGTASLIVAANAACSGLSIVNTGTTDVYLGSSSGVTILTGHLLPGTKGASVNFATTGPVYGVTGGSSATITYLSTQ